MTTEKNFSKYCKDEQKRFNGLPMEIQLQAMEYWALVRTIKKRKLTKTEADRVFELLNLITEHDITPISVADDLAF